MNCMFIKWSEVVSSQADPVLFFTGKPGNEARSEESTCTVYVEIIESWLLQLPKHCGFGA